MQLAPSVRNGHATLCKIINVESIFCCGGGGGGGGGG